MKIQFLYKVSQFNLTISSFYKFNFYIFHIYAFFQQTKKLKKNFEIDYLLFFIINEILFIFINVITIECCIFLLYLILLKF